MAGPFDLHKGRVSDKYSTTSHQILGIVKQAEAGTPIPELCREHDMSSTAFYNWRGRYGGMDASWMSRMKEFEAYSRRLKNMYAEERLKAVQKALAKKVVRPSRRREMARMTVEQRNISVRLACQAFRISKTCYRYQRKRSDENATTADWLVGLTQACRSRGSTCG